MHNVEPLVALRGITKSFPGILANDRVDFDVYPGEIHALLGENGAGKSTLVKVLYGIHQAETGTIQFGDRAVQIRSPHDARRLGIGMVFQQFTLIPALSVVENVALFLPHLPAVLDHGVIARRIEEMSGRYGLAVDPWAPAWRLSVGEQQKVEILKLLLARSRVLILDGPTRVLAPGEIVGVAGVSGNGQRELGDVILGLTQTAGGKKIIHGQDATRWSVDRIRRSGVAFVPEDPLRMLIVPPLSVLENMALADTRKYASHAGLTVDWIAVRGDLERSTLRLALEMLPPAVPAGTLSGGNVQRLSLVRELSTDPRHIVALYPTRRLEVRGGPASRHLLLAMRNRGVGELLISEDLGELFSMSDRLIVLYRGRIVGEARPKDTTVYEIGRLMTGGVAGG